MLRGSHSMFFLLCTFVVIRVNSCWIFATMIETFSKMERWYTLTKVYTLGIYVQLRLSVTAHWQMRPRAIIVRSGHSSLNLALSIFLWTLLAKKSLLSSLLLVPFVNYRHLVIEELMSFYSHTKDILCHLWLLQGSIWGPVSIPWRWDKTGKQRRPRNILPALYSYSMQIWQLSKLVPSAPNQCQVHGSLCILKRAQLLYTDRFTE